MKALVTGINGAVGVALKKQLLAGGHNLWNWDRTAVPPLDLTAAEKKGLETSVDAVRKTCEEVDKMLGTTVG